VKRVVPFLLFPGLFLLALAALFVAEDRALDSAESGWPDRSTEAKASTGEAILATFASYQEDAHREAQHAATAILNLHPDSAGGHNRGALFSALSAGRTMSITLEYYDSTRTLTAWEGPAGPEIDPGELDGRHRSYIDEGPIYSYLVIVVPVIRSDRVSGHVVAKRLFTVNHPVNNRFVSSAALAASFQSQVERAAGPGLAYLIPGHRTERTPSLTDAGGTGAVEPPKGGETFIVPLKGISGNDVGYVVAPSPEKNAWLDQTGSAFRLWKSLALIGFLVSSIVSAAWRFRRSSSGKAYQLAVLAALWVLRYAMLAVDVPGSLNPWGLFDPSLFASSFGYGAAKSLGDMVVSAFLLAVTLAVALRMVLAPDASTLPPHSRIGPAKGWRAIAALLGMLVLLGLLGPLSRGFYAVIQSVVFDSRVDLNDPKVTYPGLYAGALLLGAILLVFSSLLGGILFMAGARKLAARHLFRNSPVLAWAVVCSMAGLSSLLFDLIHPNPLGSPVERFLTIVALAGLTFAVVRWIGRRSVAAVPAVFLVVSLLSAAVLIPVLDRKVHDHDKTLIEAVVRDLARPEDAWMTYLLNQSLTSLSDSDAATVLRTGDLRATGKLAFSAWARSILASEGNTCSITFVDREGTVVSHFHVGPAPHWSREVPMDEMPRSTRFTTRESRSLQGRPTSWYRGYAPVFTPDSQFVGGVWAGIAPNDVEKILGQDQDLLNMSDKYDARTPVRNIIIAEYSDRRLVSASDDALPFGRLLPDTIGESGPGPDGVWTTEEIGGDSYETYYYPATDRTTFGVSLESLDAGWHFYSYSRYILFFTSVFLLCWGLYGLWRAINGRPWRLSFRTKLIAAFAVVSVIPVVILAYYNRESLQHGAEQSTDTFLKSETDLVLNEIQGRMGMTVPYELAAYGDETLEEISGLLNTEVYLYRGESLQASSRPDLFAADLIDRRIPAGAFEAVYLSGGNFFSEEETVGVVRYLVGYRPIRSQSGEVIGAVAVPSLSRQGAIEEDLARRDVILYGIYILVLGVALFAGTVIANQIARPVRRLTLAARQVATGDLDVRLETGRGDEIGELETAFQGMTADLRRVQERMVKVERELAWKEMAKQVAHEIKNPLTPMRLSIQHLVSSYQKGSAAFAELLGNVSTTVLEQIDALSRIASEFSAFARLPERRIDLCDVHEVLGEAIALYQREGVRFATSFVPGGAVVKADREELRRAFINIFRNSVQASEEEISIGVSTRAEGPVLLVAITDSGPGMPPAILKRLFEPNFSTKTDGMGIGLTIVKKTIDDLDGTIEVESAPGKGTTVRIRLPRTEEPGG
jgi:two-component system nitrogen regulation sensor histidine kinase NtrY